MIVTFRCLSTLSKHAKLSYSTPTPVYELLSCSVNCLRSQSCMHLLKLYPLLLVHIVQEDL